MTTPSKCPGCGEAVSQGDRFCGGCGAELTAKAEPAAARPAAAMNRTMMGISPQAVKAASPRVESALNRTMLGVVAPVSSAATPLAKKPSEPVAKKPREPVQVEVAPTQAPKDDLKRTLLGVSPVQLPSRKASPASAEAPSSEPASSSLRSQAATPAPATGQSGTSGEELKISAKSSRTMLGMSPVAGSQPVAQPRAPQPGGPVAQPRTSTPENNEPLDASPRQRSFTPVTSEVEPRESEPAAAPGLAPRRAFGLGLGAMALVLAVVALVSWLWKSGPDLHAKVLKRDGAEVLEVEVPSAQTGTKVRFSGAEKELTAGRAEFALPQDALSLGANTLPLSLVHPDGEVEAASVELDVAYRARLDVSGLASDPPTVSVVIDAQPGTAVTVDGEKVELDGRGRAVQSRALAAQTGSTLDFRARYAMVFADGGRAEGELALKLPVTALHIDRPGRHVVTDQTSLEVAGAVDPGASVTVSGQPVPVNEGRFLRQVTLADEGDQTVRVWARSPDKAPRVVDIQVRRVADLSVAAASFVFDPSLKYAKIQQNPSIYQGQSVAFNGRVYNVEVAGGHSVLQILVEDCPRGARCPLWVEYEQAADATVDSWVRVLGTVAGEQKFRSRQGNVQTVPSVQARYVLKLAR